ncbi:MAG: S9 family peptidase, partial [Chloroflexi bacterium]|nr:S9 family peptidase [Chloroflexota bacterium]
FSLGEGPAQTLHHARRQVSTPAWSPDGRSIAFLSSTWSDRGSVGGGVFVIAADGGEARELSADHAVSATWLEWSDDSLRLVTAAHEQGSVGLAEIDVASGKRRSLWRAEAALAETSWQQFSRDADGNIAVVMEDDSRPRDVWLAARSADELAWTQLTRLHPQASELSLGPVETVHWKGADGWEMQGLLVRPPMASSTDRLPLVTLVHGGPTSVHAHRYLGGSGWPQLLAAHGMAVFLPNPRGSTGWGLEFAESNIGDMGGKDWEDIRLGIDHLVERGLADPDSLGIAGWSYGGFMTAWAITQVDMFKAAMMGAGISDWRSFHGKSYLCAWDKLYYGDADPWDPDGVYATFSPINYVRRVKTPTLILHGEKDEDVPVEQAYLFHRALTDLGVETELVVYPREPHGARERNHVVDLNRRIVDWFGKHLVKA